MALERITSEVVLDVVDHTLTPEVFLAICGDSLVRYVKASLTDNGLLYIPESTATAEIYALRPDGVLVVNDAVCAWNTVPEHEPITPIETVIEVDGVEQTTYYYIDDYGNTIYVDSGDTITFPNITVFSVTGEIDQRMLQVPGIVKCQFHIHDGDQIMPTSLFHINAGINLSRAANGMVDLRE